MPQAPPRSALPLLRGALAAAPAPVGVAVVAAVPQEPAHGLPAGLTGPGAPRPQGALHAVPAPVPVAGLTPAASGPRGRLRTVAAQPWGQYRTQRPRAQRAL